MKSIKLAVATLFLVQSLSVLADTVIINTPGGGQTVCISQGGYITCY
jgi:hypothetical protein